MKVVNVIASPSSRNMVQVTSLMRIAQVAQIKKSGSTNIRIRMCTQPKQRIHRGSSTPRARVRWRSSRFSSAASSQSSASGIRINITTKTSTK